MSHHHVAPFKESPYSPPPLTRGGDTLRAQHLGDVCWAIAGQSSVTSQSFGRSAMCAFYSCRLSHVTTIIGRSLIKILCKQICIYRTTAHTSRAPPNGSKTHVRVILI